MQGKAIACLLLLAVGGVARIDSTRINPTQRWQIDVILGDILLYEKYRTKNASPNSHTLKLTQLYKTFVAPFHDKAWSWPLSVHLTMSPESSNCP